MIKRTFLPWTALLFVVAGCQSRTDEVVVYCALDREFSAPILAQFERQTGIRVLPKYDTESTKSVGLAEEILREQARPRCDVFWNNEVLNTVRLARAGALTPYASAVGRAYPAEYRSPEDLWFGFAARARVLLINKTKVDEGQEPASLQDLTLPRWRGQIGIAKPLFGTTATHVASLFASLGPEKAMELLRKLKANEVKILSGNKQVAVQVGTGELSMGLTDTDDALTEIREGRPVKMIYLDTKPDQIGMLVIPNTVAMVKGAPHPENARRLIDYLLSPEVEKELALGASGQIPLHPRTAAKPGLGIPDDAHRMDVDFDKAAAAWDEATRFVKEEFTAP